MASLPEGLTPGDVALFGAALLLFWFLLIVRDVARGGVAWR